MTSIQTVNYSTRANKAIERAIAFDCSRKLIHACNLTELSYVGFGSIWFSDFLIAHKQLGLNRLVSLECDELRWLRARFNKPFNCIELVNEVSSEALPKLAEKSKYSRNPWLAWLDYDGVVDETVINDLSDFPTFAPENSILLVTVNAMPGSYGEFADRPARLSSLFGSSYDDARPKTDLNKSNFSRTLGESLQDYIISATAKSGRPGRYRPMCLLPYRDNAAMVTIGGVFANEAIDVAAKRRITSKDWEGFPEIEISAPPLTLREQATIQAMLPKRGVLGKNGLARKGIHLDAEGIAKIAQFYRHYPQFAMIQG